MSGRLVQELNVCTVRSHNITLIVMICYFKGRVITNSQQNRLLTKLTSTYSGILVIPIEPCS